MAQTKSLSERAERGAAEGAGKTAARAGARPTDEKFSQDTALFKLLGQALAPYWRFTALALVLMLASAATNVVPPYLLQQAIDGPIRQGDVNALWRITLLYGITAVASFIFTFTYTYFLQKGAQQALADIRTRLFDHILTQDHGFLTRTPTGDLVSRLTSDIDSVNAVLSNSIVVILVEGVTLIVIIVVMFATNWRLAIIAHALFSQTNS
jgi:ATP-binding cassette subfamily B protein